MVAVRVILPYAVGMDQPVLVIVMRVLHIVSAIVAVGGLTFMLLCLTPAMRLVDDAFKASILRMVDKRFTMVLHAAIMGLIISGIYNWIRYNEDYSDISPWGQMLIGTKTLLAVVMFSIVWARAGGWLKGTPRTWMMVNVHLAAAVIILAAILRHLRLEHLAGG